MDKEFLLAMILSLDLGFSESEIRESLKHNNDQETAVNWLFEKRENPGFAGGFSDGRNVDLEAIKQQHKFSYDSLSIIVKEYGFVVVPVDHDGNCLFECLKRGYQKQAKKYGITMGSQEEIRNTIFAHLQKHKDDYVNYVENWENFCTALLTNGEWGGEIEIMCFARAFQVNIHVHQIERYENLTTRAEYKEGKFNIHLAHINDLNPLENFGRNHYVLLDPLFDNPAYSPGMVSMTEDEKMLADGLDPIDCEEEIEPVGGFHPKPDAPPRPHPNANPIEGINILADIKKHDESIKIETGEESSLLQDVKDAISVEPGFERGSILDELGKSEEPTVSKTTSPEPSILEEVKQQSGESKPPPSTDILAEIRSHPEEFLNKNEPNIIEEYAISDAMDPPVINEKEPNIVEENALSADPPAVNEVSSILSEVSDPEPLLSEEMKKQTVLSDVSVDNSEEQASIPKNNILDEIASHGTEEVISKHERKRSVLDDIGPVEPLHKTVDSDVPSELSEAMQSKSIINEILAEDPLSDVSRDNILTSIDLSSKDSEIPRGSILDDIPISDDLLNSSDRRNVLDLMAENKRDPTLQFNQDPIEILNAPPFVKEPSDDWEKVKVDADVANVGKIFQIEQDKDEDWVTVEDDENLA